ncbi:MAG: response regulator [bacterium]
MKRLLIVDDEEDLVWSLQKNLADESLDVVSAQSGDEALELLKSVSVDLIITDIRMPGMSGMDLLLSVKKLYPQTGVIIMTAYPSPEFKKDALYKGCMHFIEKPFDINRLREIIGQALKDDRGFRGTVTGIELTDVIQVNCLSKTTAALRVKTVDKEGIIFFKEGRIVHALYEDMEGEEALYEIVGFQGGTLESIKNAETPLETIDKGYEALLMEGMRRIDEQGKDGGEEQRTTKGLDDEERTLTTEVTMASVKDVLNEFTSVQGVSAVCLVGRDGFLLDRIARTGIDTEMIAAIASSGFGSAESIGRQLSKGDLSITMLEFEQGPVMFSPVGDDALLVVIADKDSNLGMIRLKIKKHTSELKLAVAF